MKVAQVKEYLSAYSDEDELMISWHDKTNFEFIFDKELPDEIWQEAVRIFNRADLQDFMEECHHFVVVAKGKVMGEE
jgi:hypothetical protein